MEESYASRYHKLEENYWWFLGRRDIIYKLIKNYHGDTQILDIGCSGGALTRFLRRQGFRRLYGIDNDEKAIEICRQKGIIDVHVADAGETGFEDQQFDIIIASDVLEHIKDEDKALFEWYRILKPEGKLIIFVPAFKFLWSKHDEVNQHYRRYSKSGLIEVLKKNGFGIEKSSYWNFSFFLPACLVRISQRLFSGNRRRSGGQLPDVNQFINKTLEYILRLENKLLSTGINLPLGISVFAIARKI
ncbi:MAG: class I SAM-dependent methyltransferase [Nitrospirota bacterium]